jgi:2-oxoglutarate ferredoxin oxidoreductase subunit gamma
MTHSIIFSGFGGQGIMLMGQLLTQAGMIAGRQVSWIPSYGPEMRGGTAYCSVTISEEAIGSPVIVEPTVVVAMNLPSVARFAPQLVPGGTLIINSSLAPDLADRKDITQVRAPMNAIADELGNPKVLNLVGLGVLIAACRPVSEEAMLKGMDAMLGKKFAGKPHILELNRTALRKGMEQGGK